MLQRFAAAALAGALALPALAQKDDYPLPPKDWDSPVHDRKVIPYLLLDKFEYASRKGADARAWDIQGWIGGDYDKLWLKSEGEQQVGGPTEDASVEVLYARLISPFWYLQAGLRYDARPEPSRTSLAVGVEGLAPYWFEVDATAYLDDQSKLSARLEAEYDILFTQRLILQPSAEATMATSADTERGLGRGFRDVGLGLRLRYEIRRQFAPYIGVTWSRKLGDTADLARRAGEETEETAVVAGLRAWF